MTNRFSPLFRGPKTEFFVDAGHLPGITASGKANYFDRIFFCNTDIDQKTLQEIIDYDYGTNDFEKIIHIPPVEISLTAAIEMKPYVKLTGIKPRHSAVEGTMFSRSGSWTGDAMIRMAHSGDTYAGNPFFLEGLGFKTGSIYATGTAGLDVAGVKYGIFRDLTFHGFEIAIWADGLTFYDTTALTQSTSYNAEECHFDNVYIQQTRSTLYVKGYNAADHSFFRLRHIEFVGEPSSIWKLKFEGYGAVWPGNEGNCSFVSCVLYTRENTNELIHIASTSGLIRFVGCRYDGGENPIWTNNSTVGSSWIGGQAVHELTLSGTNPDRIFIVADLANGDCADTLIGNILPGENNTRTCGSSTKKWSDVWTVNIHTGDIVLSDLNDAETGVPFRAGDKIQFRVMSVEDGEIRLLPVLANKE